MEVETCGIGETKYMFYFVFVFMGGIFISDLHYLICKSWGPGAQRGCCFSWIGDKKDCSASKNPLFLVDTQGLTGKTEQHLKQKTKPYLSTLIQAFVIFTQNLQKEMCKQLFTVCRQPSSSLFPSLFLWLPIISPLWTATMEGKLSLSQKVFLLPSWYVCILTLLINTHSIFSL